MAECFAHLECRLVDGRLVRDYDVFVFECVKAHAALSARDPRTIH